ncbi:D-alanyl-D-alanine carboxypeptidase [Parvularcula marina]|uniref:D-alanyl-D-alanine carboxypeptidase n=2 Tax=Parvularcula marina TaxID=2292771 RepID=A0A371R7N9_9PROT|nr:D-alanyl-D-alanine carboxypeptidase [Parvularcula marina]
MYRFQPRRILLSILAVMTCSVGVASANPKYAAYVIHAETGDVLFDRYSNETRYPASLTKMMTLYMLFEALETGEIKLTDKIPVSKRAALQPASKLGIKQGTTIDVETAIQALVIKSANDVATAVAEKLGGTESQFAAKMTSKARQIGMRRTTFRNASGLPDTRQRTTARDMATLSQRLVQDFPQYFHYFDDDSFVWDGRTYKSHNKVTQHYKGADGIKTGYTRASGYNLSTTAERDGHRLIGIVLGGRSGTTRNNHMELILSNAFDAIEKRPTLVKSIHSVRPVPGLRPDRIEEAPVLLASVKASAAPSALAGGDVSSLLPVTAQADQSTQLAALMAPTEPGIADTGPIGEGDADLDLVRNWIVQVGAFKSQPQAIEQIHRTQDTIRAVWPDAGREVNIAQKEKDPVYRARFTRLTENEASASCTALKKSGTDCLILQLAE